MGLAMGKAVGLDLPTLNWKALGVMLLTSGLTSLFLYLKQSPLPPPSTGNTDSFVNPFPGGTTQPGQQTKTP
jgi:hypothetical protein